MSRPAKHYHNPDRHNQQGKRERLIRERGSICGVCGFPGYVELHHKERVIDGGPSSDDNLILLCEYHHAIAHGKEQRKYFDPRCKEWNHS